MPLDSRYIIAPSLEQYYVDKDTGLPLSNGIITFYKDQARTELKPIFTISGTPPNYTYVQIPNPSALSSVGTFQDGGGNNIIPYYFPFDDSGNVELYYITVYSSENVLQFSREGWPNFTAESSGEENNSLLNYIPNGQFLEHNNIPATSTTLAGQITKPITIIAQGGWSFERPIPSIGTDFVLFPRYNAPITDPTSGPRYAVRISNTIVGSGDLFKDIRIKFQDVNKFSDTTQTFSFTGQTNTSGNLSLTLILFKNFGTGGSAGTQTIIENVIINNTPTIINQTINFGNNIGKSIGLLNDDFLQIVIELPLSFIFDVTFTDFILTPGIVNITQFPQTTNSQFIYRTSGYMPPPNADGFDLYLPRVKTLEGEKYDDSQIGTCFYQIREHPLPGELLCDGNIYLYSSYSIDGIPYKRLGDILLSPGNTYPLFGTGKRFVSSSVMSSNLLVITTNINGSASNSSAGTSGFTVKTHAVGSDYGFICYTTNNSSLYVKPKLKGGFPEAVPVTAGPFLVILNLRAYQAPGGISTGPDTFGLILIQMVSADNAIAGTYFTLSSPSFSYYVWFTVDGSGTDPAPGGGLIGIKVDFPSSLSLQERSIFISETLSGHQISSVVTMPASSITAGSYFNFSISPFSPYNTNYYIWYKKDGIGNDPAPGGIGILINLLGSDTAINVSTKTNLQINMFYVTVPDLMGTFIRIWNNVTGSSPDDSQRFFSYGQGQITGNVIGSVQLDEIYSHTHGIDVSLADGSKNTLHFDLTLGTRAFTLATGGSESRPMNTNLNMFIKY